MEEDKRYFGFVVKAFNKEGMLISQEGYLDPFSADGRATGLHLEHNYDTWVNEVQIFSHLTPFNRLAPGVPGL